MLKSDVFRARKRLLAQSIWEMSIYKFPASQLLQLDGRVVVPDIEKDLHHEKYRVVVRHSGAIGFCGVPVGNQRVLL